ncbi:hypothetical protein LPTSP4_10790 [Leptospira ryugenii]|uniref:Uncharacterized protein n=1 Tax=Leptospira ryugenii TaxID=1917863 RepID=A0A2P2DY43_9LEPT|nr:N-acetylmuramoyl-L-alanine amidase [Leptospira ryugenii]GBF49564.1 hypothetical protein LPTSP4_10790 [Leptospira ryugenii]
MKLFLFSIFLSLSSSAFANPVYTVVVDAGHGGVAKEPISEHGDKYDSISQTYLEKYKQGTENDKETERGIMLPLALELDQILRLTETEEGWKQFETYLSHFSKSKKWKRIIIKSNLTRKSNYEDDPNSSDPNAAYRLYDYPDKKTGERKKGRISLINEKKPHLVVSLHMNPASKGQEGGMAAVLTPGYNTFVLLKEISEGKKKASKFNSLPWSDWLVFASGHSKLENAVIDAWIYFHGYWTDRSGKKTLLDQFEGYRQNMISWSYADEKGWEKIAASNGKGPYAKSHALFQPEGKFWEREKGKQESWRREGGREGFGGDNHFASKELMRFVQYGLREQIQKRTGAFPDVGPIQKPYISTYSLPTYTNAICAFLEIGYINRKRDVSHLTKNRKEVAISLAVGIYSLFAGLEIKKNKSIPIHPKGLRINWERYQNYFQEVVKD